MNGLSIVCFLGLFQEEDLFIVDWKLVNLAIWYIFNGLFWQRFEEKKGMHINMLYLHADLKYQGWPFVHN